ncbi:phage holin family protein [Flavobacterium psychrophilum]|uniref:Phage holin family protein n=2 Tax=Flavobacterium psychrophilum TaxID=96345 RepID=A6H1C5_FLAPJ|nr:phage holin family protein [Flavobacterium psychrophilum]AIG30832.1 membrane protein [Flavobacterium psychrophilum]AIG33105.1 membrane protein [Flavobacterium psychrophilum]AIG35262.1 membrane protein [Flavobacterium psychrophilum]AIG37626.1 membrane protein [Flavobacterium psychrophilum]AIG39891.1 membrane protein [Flavobacterium psychrophilum]
MKLLLRLLITTIIVVALSYFMTGVQVDSIAIAIKVAVVLALLNTFLKPVLVFFTFPITMFTLGLFLLVINAAMVLLCDYCLEGFTISSFLTALFFSVLLSISQSVLYKFIPDNK